MKGRGGVEAVGVGVGVGCGVCGKTTDSSSHLQAEETNDFEGRDPRSNLSGSQAKHKIKSRYGSQKQNNNNNKITTESE